MLLPVDAARAATSPLEPEIAVRQRWAPEAAALQAGLPEEVGVEDMETAANLEERYLADSDSHAAPRREGP